MTACVKELEKSVASWQGVSVHPHRFAGREFRFGKAEIGHVHASGNVDIPFTRAIRDELLMEELAEEHRWAPESGWITFLLQSDREIPHALWLLRLSYLRYALKQVTNSQQFLAEESSRLALSAHLISLLQQFVPRASRPEL